MDGYHPHHSLYSAPDSLGMTLTLKPPLAFFCALNEAAARAVTVIAECHVVAVFVCQRTPSPWVVVSRRRVRLRSRSNSPAQPSH